MLIEQVTNFKLILCLFNKIDQLTGFYALPLEQEIELDKASLQCIKDILGKLDADEALTWVQNEKSGRYFNISEPKVSRLTRLETEGWFFMCGIKYKVKMKKYE
jgi:hypothetical protein